MLRCNLTTVARAATLAAALATTLAGPPALAQERFPSRPVQLILPFGPGGSDAMFRAFAQSMSNVMNGQFLVVNREGGTGRIGSAAVASARPDGYTLLVGPTTPIANLPYMFKDLPYTYDSFEHVCQVFVNPFAMVVKADSRFKTLKEIVDYARANPGKLNYGHSGIFTGAHINVETLQKQANVSFQQVPFRGDAAILTALLGGQLDFSINSTGAISTRPDTRPIAVFWDRRHPAIPDVPSVTELGFPNSPPGFQGVFAPKGTPKPVTEALEKACEAATKDTVLREFAGKQGVPLVYLTGAQFSAVSRADYELKGRIFKELGLKQE